MFVVWTVQFAYEQPGLLLRRVAHAIFRPCCMTYLRIYGSSFCCDSFSVWYGSETFVRWSHLFCFFFWGVRFVSVVVCTRMNTSVWYAYYLLFFICFPPEVIFNPELLGPLSCDHGLHCSHELMWEQQQHTHNALSVVALWLRQMYCLSHNHNHNDIRNHNHTETEQERTLGVLDASRQKKTVSCQN